MSQTVDAQGRPVVATQEVVESRPSAGLRVFQIVSAIAGAILFGMGLAAVFEVDFGADLLDTTGSVAGYGFSAASAVAAILLGGAILVSTLADQDRGSAAFVGLVTLAIGIAALVAEGQTDADIQVDNKSAALFIVLGAVVFVCSLVPWWGRRRVTRVVR